MGSCSEALRQLWQQSFAAPDTYFACLQKKFADRGDHAVAQRAPVPTPLPNFSVRRTECSRAACTESLGANSNVSTAASLSAVQPSESSTGTSKIAPLHGPPCSFDDSDEHPACRAPAADATLQYRRRRSSSSGPSRPSGRRQVTNIKLTQC